MNSSPVTMLADRPQERPARSRRLRQLVDDRAAAAARASLQSAASHAARDGGILAGVLALAEALTADALAPEHAEAMHELLCATIDSPGVRSLIPGWIRELREIASSRPDTGACTVATALEVWQWTMNHFRTGPEAATAAAALSELAEVLCPLLAAHRLALEVAGTTPDTHEDAELKAALCHVYAAHAAAAAGAACAELVFGYRRHPRWDAEGCASCYDADELDALEGWIPGITSGARSYSDIIEPDGSHPAKAGPCARFEGVDDFIRLHARLDGCLTGARLARDRAAAALSRLVLTPTPVTASEGRS